MIVRSASPLVRIVSTQSCCSGVSFESRSREVIPITPFIGVRISWLMIARNWLLARLAASAASLAACNSAVWRLRSVMSTRHDSSSKAPSGRLRRCCVSTTHTTLPSRCR